MKNILNSNTSTDENFKKLIQQTRTEGATIAQPMNFPRLDQPVEPQDPKSARINQAIGQEIEKRMKEVTEMRGGLRKETVQGIEELQKFVAEQQQEEKKEETKAERGPEKFKPENDDWVYDDYGNAIRNMHANTKRRKAIEARCSEMDIAELLINQYVEQNVPISDKVTVTYRSITGKEDLLIKSIMAKEVHYANQISSAYTVTKWGLLKLATSLTKINGRPFPEIKDAKGKPDEALLLNKLEIICNYPIEFLLDLDINHIWFTERVKALTVSDNIINF